MTKLDNRFDKIDKDILGKHGLMKPSDFLASGSERLDEERRRAGEMRKQLGRLKRGKSQEVQNETNKEIGVLKKYRETINDVIASFKYKKTGERVRRSKQTKRNA